MKRAKEAGIDIKVVLLGKAYAGKTCLLQRYLNNQYSDTAYQNVSSSSSAKQEHSYAQTIGAAFASKKLQVGGKPVTLNIWDTAGSERYQSMSKIYYRGARAAILCYDLTDKTSFEKVRFWVGELQANEQNCRLYLCGTKKDLLDENPTTRAVSLDIVTSLAQDLQSDIYETSSVTGETVSDLFEKIAHEYLTNMKEKKDNESDDGVVHLDSSQVRWSRCIPNCFRS